MLDVITSFNFNFLLFSIGDGTCIVHRYSVARLFVCVSHLSRWRHGSLSRKSSRGRSHAVTSRFPGYTPHVTAKPKTLSRQKKNIWRKYYVIPHTQYISCVEVSDVRTKMCNRDLNNYNLSRFQAVAVEVTVSGPNFVKQKWHVFPCVTLYILVSSGLCVFRSLKYIFHWRS
jgi:hypothetical protein